MATTVAETGSTKYAAKKGGIRTILSLKDAVTHQNCAELQSVYEDCIRRDKIEIIFDCQALTFLDSEALELLLRIHEDLKSRGGALKLIALNEVCTDILIATRLANTLNIYKDIHGAVRKWP